MAYRYTPKLIFPLGNFKNISAQFGERNSYDGTDWGIHLGVDIDVPFESKVFSIGRGMVVYSKLHPGEFSEDGKILKRNWGGILIIAHKDSRTKKVFYSLYGHLGKRFFKKGDPVQMGELIGTIGRAMSESNGGWENEHLHFAIYDGPFHARVLPGYLKGEMAATELPNWKEPINFIRDYDKQSQPLS